MCTAKPGPAAGALSAARPTIGPPVFAIDAEGGPFHDPDADAALFDALESDLRQTDGRRLIRLPLHINDPAFADALVAAYREITGSR